MFLESGREFGVEYQITQILSVYRGFDGYQRGVKGLTRSLNRTLKLWTGYESETYTGSTNK